MPRTKNSIDYYTQGHCLVTVNFPEDNIACKFCQFYSQATKHCGLDRNLVPPYPDRDVDRLCPLSFEEDDE